MKHVCKFSASMSQNRGRHEDARAVQLQKSRLGIVFAWFRCVFYIEL